MTYVTCVTLSYNNIQIKNEAHLIAILRGRHRARHTKPDSDFWQISSFGLVCVIEILYNLRYYNSKNFINFQNFSKIFQSKSGPQVKGIECYQIPRYLFKLLRRRPGR